MTRFSKIVLSLTLGTAATRGQNLESISIASLATPESAAMRSNLTETTDSTPVKWRKTYRWSVVALGAATAADMASSFKFSHDGQKEANSFLQSGNGGYGAKGAALEAGVVGASLLVQHYLVKRHPGLHVPLAIANYAFAGFQIFNVRHNLNY